MARKKRNTSTKDSAKPDLEPVASEPSEPVEPVEEPVEVSDPVEPMDAGPVEPVDQEPELEPKKFVLKPGLSILSRRPKDFWCIQKCLKPGVALQVLISDLSEAQLLEIETKSPHFIAVEEIEIEVELDDAD